MTPNTFQIQGLSNQQVIDSREHYGKNQTDYKKQNVFLNALKSIIQEPMVVLLLLASTIYFIIGDIADGIFLALAILLEAVLTLFQDSRSKNALEKLKEFTQPKCKVIRNGEVMEIISVDLVVGDSLMIEEGTAVAADGIIVHSNDFSVNESILTGESLSVFKNNSSIDNLVFQGTTVASGLAIATITAIAGETKLGKIGKSLANIQEEKTPLELQINHFVRNMVIIGVVVFLIVWGINYFHSQNILDSLLKALTLAMSILPEEIPVAFTTFMAVGAWRLMKKGIVVKQMKTVETLGSATVICTDKTGTITENKMSLERIYVLNSRKITKIESVSSEAEKQLIRIATFASEPIPFDPMEIALHQAYEQTVEHDERALFKMIHEYPLSGKPPMMTHIFENKTKQRIIAAKGAAEAIMSICELSEIEQNEINHQINVLSSEGYRILAVGEANFVGNNFPKNQQEFKFIFKGIIAFNDPPKKNIHAVLEKFYKAGIDVKIITGDNAATTTAIAKQIGFRGYENSITGDELMKLSDVDLNDKVMEYQIFTRMFPEAKLKIVNALKANNQIVAMTGDGVNDGPALKSAHIGIAMGKKGTAIAQEAASLILVNDDLSKMVDAVAAGRRIYANLKKAFRFVISIHIPIILTVFIPLTLGWIYPNIFSPVHIIFLEIIMGPTCSILYENEPLEKNAMTEKPRPFTTSFFSWEELSFSFLQGLIITVGTLFMYQYSLQSIHNEGFTRAMVFTTLISSNIFLVLVNRSFYYSIFTTLTYKNNLVVLIMGITVLMTSLILYVRPITEFFRLKPLTLSQLGLCIFVGFITVIWYELAKLFIRRARNQV